MFFIIPIDYLNNHNVTLLIYFENYITFIFPIVNISLKILYDIARTNYYRINSPSFKVFTYICINFHISEFIKSIYHSISFLSVLLSFHYFNLITSLHILAHNIFYLLPKFFFTYLWYQKSSNRRQGSAILQSLVWILPRMWISASYRRRKTFWIQELLW